MAPVFTPQSATSVSTRRATTADNRFWLRTDNGADFDGLDYDFELSVRSALVVDWPPNVIGGLIQNGVIAWSDADGDVRRWMDALLARGNPRVQHRAGQAGAALHRHRDQHPRCRRPR
ncbi:hypothetical protein ACQ86D_38500 [Streptomyces galilaeus]